MMDWNARVGRMLFPNVRWRGDDAAMYLTFDDGPHPEATPAVLDVLSRYETKATFFLLGKSVRQFPVLVRRIADEGHTIGSHGFSHARFLFRTKSFVDRELTEAADEIQKASGIVPLLFRPPHGHFDWRIPSLARSAGMSTVLWSVSSRDYAARSSEEIFRRVTRRAEGGDVILMHDNERTKSTLPDALEQILSWGRQTNVPFAALNR